MDEPHWLNQKLPLVYDEIVRHSSTREAVQDALFLLDNAGLIDIFDGQPMNLQQASDLICQWLEDDSLDSEQLKTLNSILCDNFTLDSEYKRNILISLSIKEKNFGTPESRNNLAQRLIDLAVKEMQFSFDSQRKALLIVVFDILADFNYFPSQALARAVAGKHSDPELRLLCTQLAEQLEPSIEDIWIRTQPNDLSSQASSAARLAQLLNWNLGSFALCQALLAEFKGLPLSSAADPRYQLLEFMFSSEDELVRLSTSWILMQSETAALSANYPQIATALADLAVNSSNKKIASEAGQMFQRLRDTLASEHKQELLDTAMVQANEKFLQKFEQQQSTCS